MKQSQSSTNCYICNAIEEKPKTHYIYTCSAIYGFEHPNNIWDNLNTHKHQKYVCSTCVSILEKKVGSILRSVDDAIYKHIKDLKEIIDETKNSALDKSDV